MKGTGVEGVDVFLFVQVHNLKPVTYFLVVFTSSNFGVGKSSNVETSSLQVSTTLTPVSEMSPRVFWFYPYRWSVVTVEQSLPTLFSVKDHQRPDVRVKDRLTVTPSETERCAGGGRGFGPFLLKST